MLSCPGEQESGDHLLGSFWSSSCLRDFWRLTRSSFLSLPNRLLHQSNPSRRHRLQTGTWGWVDESLPSWFLALLRNIWAGLLRCLIKRFSVMWTFSSFLRTPTYPHHLRVMGGRSSVSIFGVLLLDPLHFGRVGRSLVYTYPLYEAKTLGRSSYLCNIYIYLWLGRRSLFSMNLLIKSY